MVLARVEQFGDSMRAVDTNGTQRLLVPTGRGIWVANTSGVSQGSGGEPYSGGGTANYAPGSVAAPVDDYPWPNAPQNDISPLGYSYRDCVDFVAWRINRDAGVTHSPWRWTWGNMRITNGDAIGWRADWATHGWDVDLPAAAGLIGWFGTKVGAYGHVNYIQAVASDGTLHVEEYNWGDTQAYGQRDIAPGSPYYPDSILGMPHT